MHSKPKLSAYNSLFLDLLRVLAALAVVYVHASDQWLSDTYTPPHGGANIGHLGVVVFFVLSGFVISYSTHSKNKGPLAYGIARLSRLYSMVIPALLITACIQALVVYLDPVLSFEYIRGASWPRYILSFFYLSESATWSAAPPINRPLWSLSYEFWYYVIFGLLFFKNTKYRSYLFIGLACVIAGPKIILMMPIWLCGCFAYKLNHRVALPYKSWSLVCLCLFLAGFLYAFLPAIPFKLGVPPLYYSNQFVTDYILGFLIGLALLFMPLTPSPTQVEKWAVRLRKMGDLTFPLYVLHHPLLILWKAVFGFQLDNRIDMWVAFWGVLIISCFLGILLERQRYFWNAFFKRLLNLPVLKTRIYPKLKAIHF
ncbi:acyltransferase family protein [Leeuwenhoekiella polynyae]|uniref:Peptidoglycan/LPS O-acetylase OafA/YrhL n=1 Tax=Leeuwenhoekiella polynyae TaxID=1550906 RepID=A0A4Q0PH97_9FLAO|nr:acyltransferase [Leeuwenhoekiella polynyae]RXG25609.1 peptidoglycan/LPS O-acetylase OafA/YrhL [Leeuwenhoekiella polynyae]